MSMIQACVTCNGEWTNEGECHTYVGQTMTKGFMITRGISYENLIQKIMERIDLGCNAEDLRLFHRKPGNNWMLPCAITKDCDIDDLFDNYNDLGFAPIFVTVDVSVNVNVVQRNDGESSQQGVELGCVTGVEEYSIGGPSLESASFSEFNNDVVFDDDHDHEFTEQKADGEDDKGGYDGGTGTTSAITPSNLHGDSTGMKLGSIFNSRNHFDETIISAAIETGYIYRSARCNKMQRVWCCKDKTCQWLARANKMWDSEIWELKSYVGVHTCTLGEKSSDHYNCTSNYIAWLMRDKFTDAVNAPDPKAIAEYCMTTLKQKISKYKAWDARRKGMEFICGNSSKKYNDIPAQLHLVKKDLKVKRQYNCKRCHKSGHNISRCPMRETQ